MTVWLLTTEPTDPQYVVVRGREVREYDGTDWDDGYYTPLHRTRIEPPTLPNWEVTCSTCRGFRTEPGLLDGVEVALRCVDCDGSGKVVEVRGVVEQCREKHDGGSWDAWVVGPHNVYMAEELERRGFIDRRLVWLGSWDSSTALPVVDINHADKVPYPCITVGDGEWVSLWHGVDYWGEACEEDLTSKPWAADLRPGFTVVKLSGWRELAEPVSEVLAPIATSEIPGWAMNDGMSDGVRSVPLTSLGLVPGVLVEGPK